jgi:hypothetical protein
MPMAIYHWMEGYQKYPNRIENVYEIVHYYRCQSQYHISYAYYLIAKEVLNAQAGSKEAEMELEKKNYLFLIKDVYDYKLEYEYSVIAYYLGKRELSQTIIHILNHCDEDSIRKSCLSNMKYYKKVWKPLVTMDISEKMVQVADGFLIEYQSSSCSIIPHEDGYLMNMRFVDYKMDKQGNYQSYKNDGKVRTVNKQILWTKEWKKKSEKVFQTQYEKNASYVDVMLNHRKSVLFTGNGIYENGNMGVYYGEYDDMEDFLPENQLKCSFASNICEKNWCFVPLITDRMEPMMIYKWFPLQIVSLNEEKSVIERLDVKEMPKIFQDVRGSTHGFLFHEEEVWMIVHIVHYGKPRDYYHMFVKMDTDLNLLGYSAPFSFEGEAIEFCLGLIVEEERVIVSYSTWDSSSKIAIYDKKYVDANIEYL